MAYRKQKPFVSYSSRVLSRGAATSSVASIAAPTGGLNAIAPLAAMPQNDAVVMENIFPTQYNVQTRSGAAYHVTGITGKVYSLMVYNGGATTKMFAAVDNSGVGAFYDVTNAGTVGAAVVTGQTGGKFEHVNITTPAGNYLYCFNGINSPQLYNGTTWTAITGASTPAITGVTTSKLKSPELFKNRLYAIEKDTATVWYLPAQSIGGAANALYLGAYLQRGGYIVRIVNAAVATANQLGDYLGFLSSEGEFLLFGGTDPATDFELKGRYVVGKPIGDRCVFRIASDVYFITTDGIFGLSSLYNDSTDKQTNALSYKILPLLAQEAQLYGNNFGWQGIAHSAGSKLLINVPTLGTVPAKQYVMNIQTGAWCLFTGWGAYCFSIANKSLYFGGDGYVAIADTGVNDFNNAITASFKPAFSYFNNAYQKQFKQVRPTFSSNATVSFNLTMNYDFQDIATSPNSVSLSVNNLWNVAWDVSWAAGAVTTSRFYGVVGTGYCATPRVDIIYKGAEVSFIAFDFLYETGGVL